MFDTICRVTHPCLVALLLASPLGSLAQPYPAKPVRLIVGYPPGGPYDPIARAVAHKMSETLGQAIIVDLRGGAAGAIGADAVAKSLPDGYTLLFMGSAFAIAPSVTARLPFDPVKSFAAVGQVATGYDALIVNSSLPARSVRELIVLAKKNPGKLTFASSGTGGPLHLHGELFKQMTGISMLHVPYKGAGPAVTDVVGGHADLMFIGITGGLTHIRSGKVRALAVSSRSRLAGLPDVPTMGESGLPDFIGDAFTGILAPAGTSREVISALNTVLVQALQSQDVKERFAAMLVEPKPGTPEAFDALLRIQIATWAKVVRDSGLKVDS
jgi:tripartite-type tricarboxylate transporter receptor subunit TctC